MRLLKHKKGQAWLEFMMKWGWLALLIIIMASLLVYFDVIKVGIVWSDRCKFSDSFSCDTPALTSLNDGSVQARFMLRQRAGPVLVLDTISISLPGFRNSTECEVDFVHSPKGYTIGNKDSLQVECSIFPSGNESGFALAGKKAKAGLKIEYRQQASEFLKSVDGYMYTTVQYTTMQS